MALIVEPYNVTKIDDYLGCRCCNDHMKNKGDLYLPLVVTECKCNCSRYIRQYIIYLHAHMYSEDLLNEIYTKIRDTEIELGIGNWVW